MSRFTLVVNMLVCCGLLLGGIPGCSSEREKVADEFVDVLNEYADRLEKIKSNVDVVEAKPDIQKLDARMKDVAKKMEKLGDGTAEERAEMEKEYKPKFEKASARIKDQITRISKDVDQGAAMGLGLGIAFGMMGAADFDKDK